MNITNCKVEVNFIDKTALEDSTITVPANTTINTSLSLLKNRNEYKKQFVVASYNTAILDGSATLYPDYLRPYETSHRSGANRLLNASGKDFSLTYTMTQLHTSSGLTIHFLDGFASEVLIRWYNGDAILDEKTFYPDGFEYYCQNYVENFTKVYVKFVRAEYPYQHVALNYIDFGFVETFEGEKLMSASVTEEIDVTLSTVPINTFTFKIHDENGDFNPQNDNGTWRAIQKWQEVRVTEELNGNPIDIGTFYIDNWSWADNAVTFNCVSIMGVLDNLEYAEETILAQAYYLIYNALVNYGHSDLLGYYEIADELKTIILRGRLKGTFRDLIQQTCLSLGAVCDTTRGKKFRIYKPDRNMDSIIGIDRKLFGKSSNEIIDKVSSVKINWTKYFPEEEELSVTSSNGDDGKQIEYSGLNLSQDNMQDVCDELLNQNTLRQKVKLEYICNGERVGEWVGIQDSTNPDKIAVTRIDKQTIDLTGGFIATAECTGYSTVTTEVIEMGNDELIMEDNVL